MGVENVNMTELLGPQTVGMYNAANSWALGFGMTVVGILMVCYILAIVARPFFYMFFVIKLGYQGICEILRLIKSFFMGIFSFFRFIWSEGKKYLENHPEIKEACIEKKEKAKEYINRCVSDVKAYFKKEENVL